MNLKFYLSFLLCLLPLMVQALPSGEVVVIRGEVMYEAQKLTKGMIINDGGLITTGKKSFVKIKVKDWGTTIVLGPRTKMKVNLASKNVKKKYSLTAGACRWRSIINAKAKKKGVIYTPVAALGVRGTDFILKVNPVLGESEIVVIDGLVNFQNLNKESDSSLISKGQWGGLGGRFGQEIGEVLNLPKRVLKHFDRQMKI